MVSSTLVGLGLLHQHSATPSRPPAHPGAGGSHLWGSRSCSLTPAPWHHDLPLHQGHVDVCHRALHGHLLLRAALEGAQLLPLALG